MRGTEATEKMEVDEWMNDSTATANKRSNLIRARIGGFRHNFHHFHLCMGYVLQEMAEAAREPLRVVITGAAGQIAYR